MPRIRGEMVTDIKYSNNGKLIKLQTHFETITENYQSEMLKLNIYLYEWNKNATSCILFSRHADNIQILFINNIFYIRLRSF